MNIHHLSFILGATLLSGGILTAENASPSNAETRQHIEDVTIRRLKLDMEGGGTAEMITAPVNDNPFSYPDARRAFFLSEPSEAITLDGKKLEPAFH